MQYMFPYKRVRPNSRIVLYGAGMGLMKVMERVEIHNI